MTPAPTEFTIKPRSYDHPDAVALVRALFEEQVARYGYADPAQAEPAAYAPPTGLFLVGYRDGIAVCCGGYRLHDAESRTVEIKKMYTVPQQRGQGFGARILQELERQAALGGAKRAILETGVRNTGALALYSSFGYLPTQRYVPGRDPAINRAFLKELCG
ncbi:GNAT family N-acetyltransferase [Thermoactinospora rubra]|uniref:GNAT family N-acetyltransferase n=1 Tax=Thermoactinospora rubra TaxID=1088767 RepID=UPI000A0F58AF|nr:GNAT family N-acetyltransferase [Thermoactinospora rubra]